MRKVQKKLVLKRETVRGLRLRTGLRTGADDPDFHTGSGCHRDTPSAPSGSGGTQGSNGGTVDQTCNGNIIRAPVAHETGPKFFC
jgi:hypothetical protein